MGRRRLFVKNEPGESSFHIPRLVLQGALFANHCGSCCLLGFIVPSTAFLSSRLAEVTPGIDTQSKRILRVLHIGLWLIPTKANARQQMSAYECGPNIAVLITANEFLVRHTPQERFILYTATYFNHGATVSPDQIFCNGCRCRTSAAFLPFTNTSAASERVL